jgi:glycine oxidase
VREVDYIVVGFGIAGLCFAEQLENHNKSFIVIDSELNTSTKISGGVFNPVVLKRFTIAWKANEHSIESLEFYRYIAKKLSKSFLKETAVLRILSSVEEQNNWTVASDKNELSPFLYPDILQNDNSCIEASFGFGRVKHTARIEPSYLLSSYKEYLQKENRSCTETFDYGKLIDQFSEDTSETGNEYPIRYGDISAKRIVFSEGFGAIHNPYFPKSYLIANKGEYLIIRAPSLKLDDILKGPVFIIPLGDQLFKVGATYARDIDSYHTTTNARNQICRKLEKMITCDYKVISQVAGVRPTTKDRRPLLGKLPESPNKAFLNGLGSHGILGAPFLSKILYEHLENDVELPKEMDIQRWLL